MAQSLRIEIIGDSRSYAKALEAATGHTKSFGSSLARLGKVAAVSAGVAGLGAVAVTLKRGFAELSESQKVIAQTGAVLKSTGKAANVSAKQVESLATSLSVMSGADDEAVQSGENMLLTFTNIRNQVGKNNDIFTQATKATLDMATAMNQGATPSAEALAKQSILVGKALNDPVKGMTALRRVGVSFTEGQVKTIKTLVESGKTMEAQKLILHELNKEFGGSAEAAGKTLPGQLNILKNQFDELAGTLAARLLPAINNTIGWINQHWPEISATFNAVADGIGAAVGGIKVAVEAIIPIVQNIVDWFQQNWPQISAITLEVVNRIVPVLVSTFNTIRSIIFGTVSVVRAIWSKFGSELQAITVAAFEFIRSTIQNVMNVIRGIVNVIGGLIHGDWSRVWTGIQQIFGGIANQILAALKFWATALRTVLTVLGKALLVLMTAAWNGIVAVISSAAGRALAAAAAVGRAIVAGIKAGLAAVYAAVKGGLDKIWSAISTVAKAAFGAALAIGQQIVSGVIHGVANLARDVASAVGGGIKSGLSSAAGFLGIHSPSTVAAEMLGKPLAEGVIAGFASVMATRGAEFAAPLKAAALKIAATIKELTPKVTEAFRQMADDALAAFDEMVSDWKPPALKLLEKMQLEDQINSAVKAVADAQAKIDATVAAQQALTRGEGESDADFAARQAQAQADVKSAIEELGAAQRSYTELQLQLQAEQQQKAHDKQMAADRAHLAARLLLLQTELAKHPEEYAKIQQQIIALLKKYNVPMHNVGKGLAEALGKGLNEGIQSVINAAKRLANALEQITGPVSAASGGGGSGRGTGTSGYRPGGGTTIVVNAGTVVTPTELVDAIHTGLLRKQQRNGNLGLT